MSQPPYPQQRPQPPGRPRAPYAAYETRRDVEAALAASQELGPEYSDQVAEGLAERVETLAAMRLAELRHTSHREGESESIQRTAQRHRFVTAIVSLGAGIPITAIALVQGGLAETVVCWAGIVGVNMAQTLGSRRRPTA
jgi:VIT1/CCC1 family predicted Fe2+/Mn2+ transporter